MFDTYADIFNRRGAAYHEAMQRYPLARDNEFQAMVRLLEPLDGQVVVDMPSGGGYLSPYLDGVEVDLVAIETAEAFHAQSGRAKCSRRLVRDLYSTGLEAASVDAIVSLAGLHHVENRRAVFQEMYRILKPGGRLCLADVEWGSVIEGFLDTFVHQHNSMGHVGDYIDDAFRDDLAHCGFAVDFDQCVGYTWDFANADQMVEFCTLMFGIDRATPQQIARAIGAHQGYRSTTGTCAMDWELRFIRCTKRLPAD